MSDLELTDAVAHSETARSNDRHDDRRPTPQTSTRVAGASGRERAGSSTLEALRARGKAIPAASA